MMEKNHSSNGPMGKMSYNIQKHFSNEKLWILIETLFKSQLNMLYGITRSSAFGMKKIDALLMKIIMHSFHHCNSLMYQISCNNWPHCNQTKVRSHPKLGSLNCFIHRIDARNRKTCDYTQNKFKYSLTCNVTVKWHNEEFLKLSYVNTIHYMITAYSIAVTIKNIDHTFTLNTLPSWVTYGISIVNTWQKTCLIITKLNCNYQSILATMYPP